MGLLKVVLRLNMGKIVEIRNIKAISIRFSRKVRSRWRVRLFSNKNKR